MGSFVSLNELQRQRVVIPTGVEAWLRVNSINTIARRFCQRFLGHKTTSGAGKQLILSRCSMDQHKTRVEAKNSRITFVLQQSISAGFGGVR